MKKIRKWLAISACALFAGACIAPTIASDFAQATERIEWSDVTLSGEYVRDDVLQIPARTMKIGEKSYTATVKIRYPDGTTRLADGDTLALTEAGKYTLIYEAKDAASQYQTKKETFVVADKLWRVTNAKSSVEYGEAGASSEGLLVTLAKGDTLTFNKIFDVSALNPKETLIEGFITPTTVGMSEFERLTFTFTDVEDPTQYMTIICSRSQSSDNYMFMSYWTAAGNGQTQGGLYNSKFVTNAQSVYGLCGTPMGCSFYSYDGKYYDASKCTSWAAEADSTSFSILFDAENAEVSVGGKYDGNTNTRVVARLADSAYYEKEPLWQGFPSGKARLSIQAVECSGETASFCISKLASYDLRSENKFKENGAPEITVNADEKFVRQDGDRYSFIPYAVVGGKYPVPTATAFDDYAGAVSVETKVYFNYGNEAARKECAIQNGTFSVTNSGTYAIVYSATDAFGNEAKREYWITAVKELETPVSITLSDKETDNGVCGESITLATPNVTGGSGADVGGVTVKTIVSCGDTVIEPTDGTFLPEQAGTWTVRYIATDYSGKTAEASYTITIEKGTIPVFVEKPTLWKYLMSGMRYVVPEVYAYDYSSGVKTPRLAEMILEDENGKHTYSAGAEFVPVASETSPSVRLTFSVGGATYTKTINAVFPIEQEDGSTYVYIDKAFLSQNAEVTRDASGLTLLASENGDFSWSFVNAVAANEASLSVKGIQGKSKYDSLLVTFTDAANSDISVTMKLDNTGNYARVRFGDTDRTLVKGLNLGKDAAGKALDEFVFSYKLGKFYVDAVGVTVTKDDNGNAFEGFPSEHVYISAAAVNAEKENGYIVTAIDNHKISDKDVDRTAPRISIDGVYGGMYEIGDTYVITRALVSDAMDACAEGYLTVKAPDGTIASDEDGLSLNKVSCDKEYKLRLTKYGQYIVEYSAKDFVGNSKKISYSVNIFDRELPSVRVADTWSATASVGEKVTLPEVYVSDNASTVEEMTVYRYVRNQNGVVTKLGYDYTVNADGNLSYTKYTYTFRYAGTYRFVILVTDKEGNQATAQYFVTVQ